MASKTSHIAAMVLILFFFSACKSSADKDLDVIQDIEGTLIWGGSPAVDGIGVVLEAESMTYGIPGEKSDHSDLFFENSNSVNIKTDLVLTGEKSVRGWGVTYEEAILVKPERLPQTSE